MQDYGTLVDLLSNVGAMGFVFMLVWRTFNYTIPNLAKSFEDSMQASRDDFRAELRQQRGDFSETLREHRKFLVQLGKTREI